MFGKRVKRLFRVNSTKGDFEKSSPIEFQNAFPLSLEATEASARLLPPFFAFQKCSSQSLHHPTFWNLDEVWLASLRWWCFCNNAEKLTKWLFSYNLLLCTKLFINTTKNLEWKFKTFLRKNQLCKLQKFCKNVPLTEHLLSQKFVFRYKLKRVSLGSSWVNFLVTCCPSRWSNFERRWRISLTLLCSLLFRSWISREGFLCYTKKVRWVGGKTFIKQLLLAVVSSEDE